MKKWKKRLREAGILAMTAVMAMTLAGCGKSDGSKQADGGEQGAVSEYTYTAEFHDLKLAENADPYYLRIANGKLYYPADEYGETETTVIHIEALTDQKELGAVRIDTTDETENARTYVPGFAVRPDDGIVAIKSRTVNTDETTKTDVMLCLFDASGTMVTEVDVKKAAEIQEDYFYVSSVVCDGENKLYVFAGNRIYLFHADLKYHGSVDLGDVYPSMNGTGKDGKVYISYHDYNKNANILRSVEYEQKTLGDEHTGFVVGDGSFAAAGNGSEILACDESDVYEYDVKSNLATKLFSWLDCDILGTYVRDYAGLEDGRIAVVLENDDYSGESLVFFTKVKSSEVAQKKQITIASLYDDYEMKRTVIRFNKQSSEYHVNLQSFEVKGDYSEEAENTALTNLNNALTAKKGIDLVLVNNLPNFRALVSKGMFEDLGSYLDQSSKMKRSDYLENLLEAGTVDGKLIFIPKNFNVQTYVGKKKLVGEKSGWTMDDLLKLSKSHPDAKMFDWSMKDDALDMCLKFTAGTFIDENTGKCSFDSEDFKKVLEFVNAFPDEYDWENLDDNFVEQMQNDKLLLEQVYMYNLGGLQICAAEFGEEVTFIGYPTTDGSVSNLLVFDSPNVALVSGSDDKEGAWKFMEYYLDLDDEMYSHGLPSQKKRLEELMQECMTEHYMTDENGQVLKDENGQLIPLGLGSTWYGDWSYDYHVSTKEEMDQEYAVITSAKVSGDIDDQILTIIREEAAAYFEGQKTVDDVADIIQSRVQLYVNENR